VVVGYGGGFGGSIAAWAAAADFKKRANVEAQSCCRRHDTAHCGSFLSLRQLHLRFRTPEAVDPVEQLVVELDKPTAAILLSAILLAK